MPTFQHDEHAVHCVLGSVSSKSKKSMLPTSWIIFFDSGLNGFLAWFCRRSCWRACRSGWFSIFWFNSRTLVLCACFTTECGNPGIRKSMFTSFSIVWHDLDRHDWQRVSPFFHEVFYLQRRMFRFHDKNVLENYLVHFVCSFQQRDSSFFHVPFQRWDPYCLQMNVLGLHSFQQWVSLFSHDLDFRLVGSIGNFQKVAQLQVVEHVLIPISSSNSL